MEQVYIPQRDYKVLVRCMTYNQSKYIEDALNGFAMQQTDFPFVCLVMDDCSTDEEQDVIKAWMTRECDMEKAENIEIEKSFITLVPHKTNANCHFAFYFLKQNLYRKGGKAPMIAPWREHCEYEALCEGDDYWISPEKLQKQVEFLDSHPDYSMCFTNATEHWESGIKEDKIFSNIEGREYDGIELLQNWIVPTASMIYRTSVLTSDVFQKASKDHNLIYGDIVLCLSSAQTGRVFGMADLTCVYRRLETGAVRAMHKSNPIQVKLCMHLLELAVVFGEKYKSVVENMYHERCVISSFHNLKNFNLKYCVVFLSMSLKLSWIGTAKAFVHLFRK